MADLENAETFCNNFSTNGSLSLRGRELFPTDDSDGDELGHISPLSSSTPPNSPRDSSFYKEEVKRLNFSGSTIDDYVILENIHDNKKERDTNSNNVSIDDERANQLSPLNKSAESNNSSFYQSPVQSTSFQTAVSSPKKLNKYYNKVCDDEDTPSKKVADFNRETPGDGGVQQECSDFDVDCGNKRKNPFSESPLVNNKQAKMDHSSSKVRIVLFPQKQTSVPTSSFYSKSDNPLLNNSFKNVNSNSKKSKQKSAALYLCARNKRFGQINAGVRHNIKKPKRKKGAEMQSNAHILKAAENIIDNSELNDYFESVAENTVLHQNTFAKKIIDVIETIEKTSKKRERTPSPDPNKKFFKFKRTHQNATVTVDKHMKLRVEDGGFSLLTNKKQKRHNHQTKPKINLDLTDLTVPENDDLISSERIDDILFSLDNDNNKENNARLIYASEEDEEEAIALMECSDHLVLHAHNSVAMSENAILLHTPPSSTTKANAIAQSTQSAIKQIILNEEDKSILLSPTSQMCNMTSVLALNSPIKAKQNIINDLLNNSDNNTMRLNEINSCSLDIMEQEKLFPIFYGQNNRASSSMCSSMNATNNKSSSSKASQPVKKFKPLPKNQLLLDAGQKRFGVTQCPECKFVYHMGDPNDELIHLNYHNAGNVLRFNGWKDEHIVSQLPNNARIIRVVPSDPKPWIKKVKELLEVVNRDLGYYDMDVNLENSQVFLYIRNKTILGCAVAETKTIAYRMLNDISGIDLCSEQSYPIKCGISRIWVSQSTRREGVGTSLLNCLRGNFMFGNILSKDDLAFSSPTEAGKAFAMKYFNTPNFLVYT